MSDRITVLCCCLQHSTVLLFGSQYCVAVWITVLCCCLQHRQFLPSLLYEHELPYFTDSEAYDDGFTVHCGIITAAVQGCHYKVSLCLLLSSIIALWHLHTHSFPTNHSTIITGQSGPTGEHEWTHDAEWEGEETVPIIGCRSKLTTREALDPLRPVPVAKCRAYWYRVGSKQINMTQMHYQQG